MAVLYRRHRHRHAIVERLRAADIVLGHTAKAIEIEDIEVRVAALEAAAASGEQRR